MKMRPTVIARSLVLAALGVVAGAAPTHAQQQPMQGMWGSTGQYRGATMQNGQVYGPDNRYVGQVQRPSMAPSTSDGGFGRSTAHGATQARRQGDSDRPVYGANGQYLGQVNRQGQFYDAQGVYRGQMR